ncbi:unnamed protein product [Trichobilharzia szidati]|nr:unnamed protein product [Trichobilharzia szidati]
MKCSAVKTITTNTVTRRTPPTRIPFGYMHNSSSMSTPSPSKSSAAVFFGVCSIPTTTPPLIPLFPPRQRMMTNNSHQHSNTETHSWNNNNQWLSSVPVGEHRKHLDSTLNNSDSGFLSGDNSHSSGLTDNRTNQFDIVSDEYTRLTVGCPKPLDTPNVVHSLTDLLMNSMSPPFEKLEENEQEEDRQQQQQRFSAFRVPVKTTTDSSSSNLTSNYFHRQHDTMTFNPTTPPPPTTTATTPTNFVSCDSNHDTVKPTTTTTSPPIWRPYLD